MNRLILLKKETMEQLQIENVVQLDLCNMSVIGDDVSDSGWNFISIITRENGQLKKQVIKLEDIMQFSIVEIKE